MACRESVYRQYLAPDAVETNLMEAHTWLRVLTEARSPRARMAKGALAETTVVPVVIAVSVAAHWLVVDGRTAHQTNVHLRLASLLERLGILPLEQ